VKQTLPLAAALAVLWFLLSGHLEPLILAFGVLSIIFVTWIARRMHVVDGESYPFGLIPRLSGFWLWLLKEIVKSNIDTARRVLGPRSAVEPVVFDAPAAQHSDLGIVIYANSITLTPGTVSLELESDRISVHAIHPDVAQGLLDSGMNERVPEPGARR
jgi:multicomponent Na+:H+ antiporter subunit E